MIELNSCSRACVCMDQWSDYIPGLSSITNTFDFILHYMIRPLCCKRERVLKSHYFTYLETKNWCRAALVTFVPVMGNIYIMKSACNREEREEALREGRLRQARGNPDCVVYYKKAFRLGSAEGLYLLGRCANR